MKYRCDDDLWLSLEPVHSIYSSPAQAALGAYNTTYSVHCARPALPMIPARQTDAEMLDSCKRHTLQPQSWSLPDLRSAPGNVLPSYCTCGSSRQSVHIEYRFANESFLGRFEP